MIYIIEYYNEYVVDGVYECDTSTEDKYFKSIEDAEYFLEIKGFVKNESEVIKGEFTYKNEPFNEEAGIVGLELFIRE